MNKGEKRISVTDIKNVVHIVATEMLSSLDEPIPPFETHDRGKLEGAIAAPFQSAAQVDIYPTVYDKGAALFYFVAKDHAFENGNKRIAVVTLLYYLASNGLAIKIDPKTLYEVAVMVVASTDSKDIMVGGFAKILSEYCMPYDEWIKAL